MQQLNKRMDADLESLEENLGFILRAASLRIYPSEEALSPPVPKTGYVVAQDDLQINGAAANLVLYPIMIFTI